MESSAVKSNHCVRSKELLKKQRRRVLVRTKEFLTASGTRKWRLIRGEVDQDTRSKGEIRQERAVNKGPGTNSILKESNQYELLPFCLTR